MDVQKLLGLLLAPFDTIAALWDRFQLRPASLDARSFSCVSSLRSSSGSPGSIPSPPERSRP